MLLTLLYPPRYDGPGPKPGAALSLCLRFPVSRARDWKMFGIVKAVLHVAPLGMFLLVVLFAVAATLWPRADRPKWMTLIVDTICGGSVCKKYMGYDDASIYTTGGEFPAGHVFEDGRGASHVVS